MADSPADSTPESLLQHVLDAARQQGADSADALYTDSTTLGVSQRLGQVEDVERSEGRDLGLRVLVGKRQAVVSTTDFSREAIADLAERAVAMARAVPEDPYLGLASPDQLARTWPDLDLHDGSAPDEAALQARAAEAEDAARAMPDITNSNGAQAGWIETRLAVAATNGFFGQSRQTSHGIGVSVLAGAGTAMESGGDHHSARHLEDLESPASLGRHAGELARRRLNPQKIASERLPVVLEPRVAAGLAGSLAGALNGQAVARGTSFLQDDLDQVVGSPALSLVESPRRPRSLSARPFDAEGLPTHDKTLIDQGRIATWVLDLRTARQLGRSPTGNASRGTTSAPAPSTANLYIAGGTKPVDELIEEIPRGIYVDRMMGRGVNLVTGDYSRGAAGYLIEDGALTAPVSELTVAGNLRDMMARVTPADDLAFRDGTDSPTLRIDGMTVAGN